MFLLAHAGIAVGAAIVLNGIFVGHSGEELKKVEASSTAAIDWRHPEDWVTSLGRLIDLRALLAGALVPDIIDKPLGRLFFGTFGCRLFCHSLVLLLIVVSAGLYLFFRRRQNWLLVLGSGILTHIVLDAMWLDLQTLFWPVLGLSFPTVEIGHWEQAMSQRLVASPEVYVPELVGASVLAYLAWFLIRRGTIRAFVQHGQI